MSKRPNLQQPRDAPQERESHLSSWAVFSSSKEVVIKSTVLGGLEQDMKPLWALVFGTAKLVQEDKEGFCEASVG